MVYPTQTYGLSYPTFQLSPNGLSLLSPLVVRPRLDTFRLVFSKKPPFFHKNLSDWSKLRSVFSFPLKFQNLSFYHPMVLGGCYHNTSDLSCLLALTLFLCYDRYMLCYLYSTVSTLHAFVLLEHY